MEQLPTLETPRLVLRQLELRDVSALFGVFSDGRVTRYTSHPPFAAIQDAEELLTRIDCGRLGDVFYEWGIADRKTDVVVGTVTLFHWERAHHRADLGYAVAADLWNRGFGTEAVGRAIEYAFLELDLHRLEADVDPRNVGSLRLLEKLGFVREGFRPHTYLVDGEWQDSVLLGLLRPDVR